MKRIKAKELKKKKNPTTAAMQPITITKTQKRVKATYSTSGGCCGKKKKI